MRLQSFLLISCALCLPSLQPISTASAQGQTAAAPENILAILLRADGWNADWIGPGGSGVTEAKFEDRAGKIVAKLRIVTPIDLSCEKGVTISSNVVKFDGCRDSDVTLVFDPKDSEYPFKGKSPRGYEWKLKAR